jgi:hypothetical protein
MKSYEKYEGPVELNNDIIELLEIDSEFNLEYDTEMEYRRGFNSEREYRELRFE